MLQIPQMIGNNIKICEKCISVKSKMQSFIHFLYTDFTVNNLVFIHSMYTTRKLQPVWIKDTQNTRACISFVQLHSV